MGATHRVPPKPKTYYGRTMDTWKAWAEFVGLPPPTFNPALTRNYYGSLVAELYRESINQPDMWAAFVAAQRIQGNKIWDTEAT